MIEGLPCVLRCLGARDSLFKCQVFFNFIFDYFVRYFLPTVSALSVFAKVSVRWVYHSWKWKKRSKTRSVTSSLLLSKDLEFEGEALMSYKMALMPCLWMSVLIALNYKLLKIAAYSYTEEAYYFVSIFWKYSLYIHNLLEMTDSVPAWRSNAVWHFKFIDPLLFLQKGLVFLIFLGQCILILTLVSNSGFLRFMLTFPKCYLRRVSRMGLISHDVRHLKI